MHPLMWRSGPITQGPLRSPLRVRKCTVTRNMANAICPFVEDTYDGEFRVLVFREDLGYLGTVSRSD